jgi:hypothetical protein
VGLLLKAAKESRIVVLEKSIRKGIYANTTAAETMTLSGKIVLFLAVRAR